MMVWDNGMIGIVGIGKMEELCGLYVDFNVRDGWDRSKGGVNGLFEDVGYLDNGRFWMVGINGTEGS